MGLLDGIVGNVLGNLLGGGQQGGGALDGILNQLGGQQGGGRGNALMQIALQLMQQQGGLGGLVKHLQGAGLGQQVNSWVGTGANVEVDASQLGQALGGNGLGALAQQFGLSRADAGAGLAKLLPELVNQFTPNGEVPHDANDMLGQLWSGLSQKT